MTSEPKVPNDIVKGHCPNCGPLRFSDVRGYYQTKFSDAADGIWGITDFRILVCRGCGAAFFQTEEVFSEDLEHFINDQGETESYIPPKVQHYPSPIKRRKPDWWLDIVVYDLDLESLFSDIYKCADADLPIPAAIATRTTFDRATELLGINTSLSFDKKLDALLNLGKISLDERDTLEVLIDAGSAAAHRGWKPKAAELDTLISLIEAFLHRTFVLGEAARQLKAAVPAKPGKPPKSRP